MWIRIRIVFGIRIRIHKAFEYDPIRIRIRTNPEYGTNATRIHKDPEYGSNTDPDPKKS